MINKVKNKRLYYSMTIRELAERSDTGAMTINNLERGKTYPSIFTVLKIAKVLKIPVEELFLLEEQEIERLKIRENRR